MNMKTVYNANHFECSRTRKGDSKSSIELKSQLKFQNIPLKSNINFSVTTTVFFFFTFCNCTLVCLIMSMQIKEHSSKDGFVSDWFRIHAASSSLTAPHYMADLSSHLYDNNKMTLAFSHPWSTFASRVPCSLSSCPWLLLWFRLKRLNRGAHRC